MEKAESPFLEQYCDKMNGIKLMDPLSSPAVESALQLLSVGRLQGVMAATAALQAVAIHLLHNISLTTDQAGKLITKQALRINQVCPTRQCEFLHGVFNRQASCSSV